MQNYQRKTPILPDGIEIWIGLFFGIIIGLYLVWHEYPFWEYVLAPLFAYGASVFLFQLWTEDDRQYVKGIKLAKELRTSLGTINAIGDTIRKGGARTNVQNGVTNARLIIEELFKQKPPMFYGGLTQLQSHVRRMFGSIDEYVDLQKYPQKAGRNYLETMQKVEEGFQGFAEQMDRMLVRVNAGDIFNLTTSAELLRSLRNLLAPRAKE